MREPSYKAKRLAKMLQEAIQPFYPNLTITFDPNEIYPATGWYRTSPYADVLRWEAVMRVGSAPMGGAESWDTMTDCVRYGIKVRPGSGPGHRAHDFDVSSKGPDRWETPVKRATANSRRLDDTEKR
jgi:hypothetical protein